MKTQVSTEHYEILTDKEIALADGALFLLIVREGNQIYFEMQNQHCSVFKKKVENLPQANALLKSCQQRIDMITYVEQAEQFARFCMSFPTTNECKLALEAKDRELNYAYLKKVAGYCNVKLQIFVDGKQGDEERTMSVHVISGGNKKNIGVWRGKLLEETFRFYFNYDYLK